MQLWVSKYTHAVLAVFFSRRHFSVFFSSSFYGFSSVHDGKPSMRTEYYHDACASFVEYKTVRMKRILIAICMIWLLCPVIHASYDE